MPKKNDPEHAQTRSRPLPQISSLPIRIQARGIVPVPSSSSPDPSLLVLYCNAQKKRPRARTDAFPAPAPDFFPPHLNPGTGYRPRTIVIFPRPLAVDYLLQYPKKTTPSTHRRVPGPCPGFLPFPFESRHGVSSPCCIPVVSTPLRSIVTATPKKNWPQAQKSVYPPPVPLSSLRLEVHNQHFVLGII